jgi:hypothetical protein
LKEQRKIYVRKNCREKTNLKKKRRFLGGKKEKKKRKNGKEKKVRAKKIIKREDLDPVCLQ